MVANIYRDLYQEMIKWHKWRSSKPKWWKIRERMQWAKAEPKWRD